MIQNRYTRSGVKDKPRHPISNATISYRSLWIHLVPHPSNQRGTIKVYRTQKHSTHPMQEEAVHTWHLWPYPPSSTGVKGKTQENCASIFGISFRQCSWQAWFLIRDVWIRCFTSLNPLFLMLSFLALTKSNSLPYSSLQRQKTKLRGFQQTSFVRGL